MNGGSRVAEQVRIAVIGSGPAGLSAAAHAAKLGIPHVMLEKTDHLSDTIYKYQRGKHVMATPVQLVLRSDARFEAGKREMLLERWDEDAKPVHLKLNAEVMKIEGDKGAFTLTLKSGETVEAEAIVLAIGTQGNPNLLRVPGDFAGIQYQLDDPAEYVDENPRPDRRPRAEERRQPDQSRRRLPLRQVGQRVEPDGGQGRRADHDLCRDDDDRVRG